MDKKSLCCCQDVSWQSFAGWMRNDEVSSEYNIEYLNKDKTKIVDVPYEPEASDTDGMIKEFLAKLSSDSDNVEYRKPIPNGVEVTDYSLDGVMLSIHFDADYSSMTEVEEVLCRAAVVLTMTQIPGVDCVSFMWQMHRLRISGAILSEA